jgi:DNA-binding transcriptional regulator YiaG
MTVEEFAKELHISTKMLRAFESGEGQLPDPETLRPIIDRLEQERSGRSSS